MTLFNLITHELPLVIFTAMAQAVVGFSFLYAFNVIKGLHKEDSYKSFALMYIVMLAIALIASIFHLGNPFNAPYLLTRVGMFEIGGSWHVSWFPNEVFSVGILFVLAALLYLKPSKLLVYSIPTMGMVMLFFMSGIYGSMSSTVVTWNFYLSFVLFVASAIFLGGILYRIIYSDIIKTRYSAFIFSLMGFILFGLSLVLYTLHIGSVRIDGLVNVFDLMSGYYQPIMIFGFGLGGFALFLLFYVDIIRTFILGNEVSVSKIIPSLVLVISIFGVFATRVIYYGLVNTTMWLG
ncbi:MAG: DmsC/YnfH family molybdoenzyme membrane anchor subunit [Campylobacteraceae bacterium]